jgi:DeoR/GlpR family transcriptional regulator of sugar metabolism
MLARQRQERILDHLRRHGGVRVSELVQLLDVSDMTIRRDIQTLARRGLLERVHGGATALGGRSSEEPGFAAKSALAREQKIAIARAAARLVGDRESVAISAGTTTLAVARELLSRTDLTVVTNSPPVADLMHDTARPDRTVVLVGGVRTPSNALVGPVAVAALRTLHVDTLLLGVHGVTEHAGLTTPNLLEGETSRALVESARRVVVTADHTKWGVVGLSTIAGLDRVDVLVTDSGISADARRVLTMVVGQLVVADVVRSGAALTDGGQTAVGGAEQDAS